MCVRVGLVVCLLNSEPSKAWAHMKGCVAQGRTDMGPTAAVLILLAYSHP